MEKSNTPIATSQPPRSFRYYDIVMASFVAILLLSSIIGAAKLTFVEVGWWPDGWWPAADGIFIYGADILFFPLGYVIGDILTEIYGFSRARRVIWTGFGAMIFMAFMSYVVVNLPAFEQWSCAASDTLEMEGSPNAVPGSICQQTYESVFGSTWRIVLASITAFWAGGRVRQFLCDGKDESVDQGQGAVEPHHWIDRGWPRRGQSNFLSYCVLRHLEHASGNHSDDHQLAAQGLVGSRTDPSYLCNCGQAEESRGCRSV